MADKIFSSDRTFQVWSYIVSHKQLIIRSPKSERFATRIDVLFKGVSHIDLDTEFNGLIISTADPASVDFLRTGMYAHDEVKIFRLECNRNSGYVTAVTCILCEDDKEYYDESSIVSKDHL